MHTVQPESVGLSSARLAKIGAAMRGFVEATVMHGVITLVARHGQSDFVPPFGPLFKTLVYQAIDD